MIFNKFSKILKFRIKFFLIAIIFIFSVESCKISYSFTGASVSPDVKTISIHTIENRADLVVPTLSQSCTETLKDKFLSQTSLVLVNSGGDLNIEGEITNYRIKPMAIQSQEQASLNRLTITVKIRFTNMQDSKQDFSTSFSRFADYDSSESLDSIEEELIAEILEQINDDIFNKALANW